MILYQNKYLLKTDHYLKEIKKPYIVPTSVAWRCRALEWQANNSFRVVDEEGEDTHSHHQWEHDGSVECPDRMTYVSSCIVI